MFDFVMQVLVCFSQNVPYSYWEQLTANLVSACKDASVQIEPCRNRGRSMSMGHASIEARRRGPTASDGHVGGRSAFESRPLDRVTG